MEKLLEIDQEVFLFLNGLHNSVLDPIMSFFSEKWVWIPLYAFLLGILIYKYRSKTAWVLLALALTIVVADRGSSGIMKPGFGRLRPCHEPSLDGSIHLIDGCGGKYSFPSSHAANTFALAAFFYFLFAGNKWRYTLVIWAVIVSYSRIYLGVHYPIDIIFGALYGWIVAMIAVKVLYRFKLIEN
jgi:undecaprenyl-diphosphatase